MFAKIKPLGFLAITALLLLSSSAFAAGKNQLVSFHSSNNSVFWKAQINDMLNITVSGPDGFYVQNELTIGAGKYSLDGLQDGLYNYEVTLIPTVDHTTREIMQQARESGDMSHVKELRRQGVLPNRVSTQSGHFRIVGGSIPRSNLAE